MNLIFRKTENDSIFLNGEDGSLEASYDKFKDVTIFMCSGKFERKIIVRNVESIGEGIRDSLATMKSFISTSQTLRNLYRAYLRKEWPTLDGEPLVPTFENVDVEDLNLSSRAANALEKNDILILKQIPSKLEDISKLRSVGGPTAKEILKARNEYLAKIGPLGADKVVKANGNSQILIVDSKMPQNLKKVLLENALVFTKDIPRDTKTLCRLNKVGLGKAQKILDFLNKG